jgi:predicted RNA binding protein YcfA (HicA-like mRNA interferase family)
MSGLPVLRPRQLIRALERAGFFVHHVRGSHHYLRHPDRPGVLVTVPFHNRDLKRGTLRAILRQAGLTPQELQDLLL